MWRATWGKARADLRGRPLQTLLVFVVVVAAAATLSLAINLQASAETPYERLRVRSDRADAWINISSGADPAAIAALPQVALMGEPYPVSWENQGIRKGSVKRQVALVGLPSSLPAFDHPVVAKGRWLAADGSRELVLDAGAARLLDLRADERVTLLRAEGPVEFTVVGFAATAGRAPDPIKTPRSRTSCPRRSGSCTRAPCSGPTRITGCVWGSGCSPGRRRSPSSKGCVRPWEASLARAWPRMWSRTSRRQTSSTSSSCRCSAPSRSSRRG